MGDIELRQLVASVGQHPPVYSLAVAPLLSNGCIRRDACGGNEMSVSP